MLERSGQLRLGLKGRWSVEDDRRSLQALLEDVIVYSSWREGGEGGSRCLLLDEKRSAKLKVEELGSELGRT